MHLAYIDVFGPFSGRPSVPQLTVSRGEESTALFLCVSEGNPKPTITWYGHDPHTE